MVTKEKYKFIIHLGKALHNYGIPSYRIQAYLFKVAKNMGIKGTFMDSATWINYVFYENGNEQTYNYIESVAPGTLNLGAFSRIVETTDKLIANEIDISEMENRLKIIHNKTIKVNHGILTIAYSLAAGSFNLLVGTNWISVLFATLLGAFVYFITYLSTKHEYLKSVLESIVSFLATIITGLLSLVFPEINVGLTIISAIIIFVPGLAITTALEEITSKNLISGTAKLFDSIISLFKQFFGVILGLTCLKFFIDFEIFSHYSNTPSWIIFLAMPLLSISVLPIFQVRKKDMLFGIFTGAIGFFLAYSFSVAGILLSTFIGSIGIVISSHFFSKVTRTPEVVYVTQGIIMLVPGSKSLFGLSNVFLNTTIINVGNIGEQVAYIFMGILGGLLFGGVFKQEDK
nr:threonine/serine exporter family protein [uncultured Bacteroides sp.]